MHTFASNCTAGLALSCWSPAHEWPAKKSEKLGGKPGRTRTFVDYRTACPTDLGQQLVEGVGLLHRLGVGLDSTGGAGHPQRELRHVLAECPHERGELRPVVPQWKRFPGELEGAKGCGLSELQGWTRTTLVGVLWRASLFFAFSLCCPKCWAKK